MQNASSARAENVRREALYTPASASGFVGWVTGFDYGDGRLGLSFKEVRPGKDPGYQPPKLEMGEAVGAPVSYCSVECGSEDTIAERVYMASDDCGKTWRETGRCPLDAGSFSNIGFPDGRIVGMDVGRSNEERTGWCDYVAVRESCDGGTSWRETQRLLEGCAVYLWRIRRLRDGSFLVLACLYGTPWGPGRARMTRNTMLPDETYLSKIQTFFLHSTDGRRFSGPHYVLPGIGAHEYEAVELENGDILFLAGDVQATPVGRQLVRREGERFINGPMLPIRRGAPAEPDKDPQGGFVPETAAALPGDLLVGARRNKPYSVSGDLGANWYELPELPVSLYQPYLMRLPDGSIANFGHEGGDDPVSTKKMSVGADFFRVAGSPPQACELTLQREMDGGNEHYVNRYKACLRCRGQAVAGQPVVFRFAPYWNDNGTVNTAPQEKAPIQKTAVTDENGEAWEDVSEYDTVRDIHFYYNVDAAFMPAEGEYAPCRSPLMNVAAMTPRRRCRWPYEAYLAENTLFISPMLEKRFPQIFETLRAQTGSRRPELEDAALAQALRQAGVLDADGQWAFRVHTDGRLHEVLSMGAGDWYE